MAEQCFDAAACVAPELGRQIADKNAEIERLQRIEDAARMYVRRQDSAGFTVLVTTLADTSPQRDEADK